MGRKLWFLTGGALAAGLAIVLLGIFVPFFEDVPTVVEGWRGG